MKIFTFAYTVKNESQESMKSNSIAFGFSATTESELIKEASNLNLTDIQVLTESEAVDLFY